MQVGQMPSSTPSRCPPPARQPQPLGHAEGERRQRQRQMLLRFYALAALLSFSPQRYRRLLLEKHIRGDGDRDWEGQNACLSSEAAARAASLPLPQPYQQPSNAVASQRPFSPSPSPSREADEAPVMPAPMTARTMRDALVEAIVYPFTSPIPLAEQQQQQPLSSRLQRWADNRAANHQAVYTAGSPALLPQQQQQPLQAVSPSRPAAACSPTPPTLALNANAFPPVAHVRGPTTASPAGRADTASGNGVVQGDGMSHRCRRRSGSSSSSAAAIADHFGKLHSEVVAVAGAVPLQGRATSVTSSSGGGGAAAAAAAAARGGSASVALSPSTLSPLPRGDRVAATGTVARVGRDGGAPGPSRTRRARGGSAADELLLLASPFGGAAAARDRCAYVDAHSCYSGVPTEQLTAELAEPQFGRFHRYMQGDIPLAPPSAAASGAAATHAADPGSGKHTTRAALPTPSPGAAGSAGDGGSWLDPATGRYVSSAGVPLHAPAQALRRHHQAYLRLLPPVLHATSGVAQASRLCPALLPCVLEVLLKASSQVDAAAASSAMQRAATVTAASGDATPALQSQTASLFLPSTPSPPAAITAPLAKGDGVRAATPAFSVGSASVLAPPASSPPAAAAAAAAAAVGVPPEPHTSARRAFVTLLEKYAPVLAEQQQHLRQRRHKLAALVRELLTVAAVAKTGTCEGEGREEGDDSVRTGGDAKADAATAAAAAAHQRRLLAAFMCVARELAEEALPLAHALSALRTTAVCLLPVLEPSTWAANLAATMLLARVLPYLDVKSFHNDGHGDAGAPLPETDKLLIYGPVVEEVSLRLAAAAATAQASNSHRRGGGGDDDGGGDGRCSSACDAVGLTRLSSLLACLEAEEAAAEGLRSPVSEGVADEEGDDGDSHLSLAMLWDIDAEAIDAVRWRLHVEEQSALVTALERHAQVLTHDVGAWSSLTALVFCFVTAYRQREAASLAPPGQVDEEKQLGIGGAERASHCGAAVTSPATAAAPARAATPAFLLPPAHVVAKGIVTSGAAAALAATPTSSAASSEGGETGKRLADPTVTSPTRYTDTSVAHGTPERRKAAAAAAAAATRSEAEGHMVLATGTPVQRHGSLSSVVRGSPSAAPSSLAAGTVVVAARDVKGVATLSTAAQLQQLVRRFEQGGAGPSESGGPMSTPQSPPLSSFAAAAPARDRESHPPSPRFVSPAAALAPRRRPSPQHRQRPQQPIRRLGWRLPERVPAQVTPTHTAILAAMALTLPGPDSEAGKATPHRTVAALGQWFLQSIVIHLADSISALDGYHKLGQLPPSGGTECAAALLRARLPSAQVSSACVALTHLLQQHPSFFAKAALGGGTLASLRAITASLTAIPSPVIRCVDAEDKGSAEGGVGEMPSELKNTHSSTATPATATGAAAQPPQPPSPPSSSSASYNINLNVNALLQEAAGVTAAAAAAASFGQRTSTAGLSGNNSGDASDAVGASAKSTDALVRLACLLTVRLLPQHRTTMWNMFALSPAGDAAHAAARASLSELRETHYVLHLLLQSVLTHARGAPYSVGTQRSLACLFLSWTHLLLCLARSAPSAEEAQRRVSVDGGAGCLGNYRSAEAREEMMTCVLCGYQWILIALAHVLHHYDTVKGTALTLCTALAPLAQPQPAASGTSATLTEAPPSQTVFQAIREVLTNGVADRSPLASASSPTPTNPLPPFVLREYALPALATIEAAATAAFFILSPTETRLPTSLRLHERQYRRRHAQTGEVWSDALLDLSHLSGSRSNDGGESDGEEELCAPVICGDADEVARGAGLDRSPADLAGLKEFLKAEVLSSERGSLLGVLPCSTEPFTLSARHRMDMPHAAPADTPARAAVARTGDEGGLWLHQRVDWAMSVLAYLDRQWWYARANAPATGLRHGPVGRAAAFAPPAPRAAGEASGTAGARQEEEARERKEQHRGRAAMASFGYLDGCLTPLQPTFAVGDGNVPV